MKPCSDLEHKIWSISWETASSPCLAIADALEKVWDVHFGEDAHMKEPVAEEVILAMYEVLKEF